MKNSDLLPADTVRALARREFLGPSDSPSAIDPAVHANLQGIVSMAMHCVGAEAVKKAARKGAKAPAMIFEVRLTPKTPAALNSRIAQFMQLAKGGHYADVLGANGHIIEKGVLRPLEKKRSP